MAVRNIIRIDESKCDGCGDCTRACTEGAIQIIDGKARLVSDVNCDGLGACLGSCYAGAITVEKREAADYNKQAAQQNLRGLTNCQKGRHSQPVHSISGCPGSGLRMVEPLPSQSMASVAAAASQLRHWPVQLMLVPPHAPFLKQADLLICADCVPFAVPDFHDRYLKGRTVLVGCPKLDDLQFYMRKLAEIFKMALPSRLTVLKMEVPCCHGIARAALAAASEAGLEIPLEAHTIGINGLIQVEKHASVNPTA